ncbi:MAG: ABC transporter permease [Spirochaetia bacterium]|jgi:ribose transport system permease protein
MRINSRNLLSQNGSITLLLAIALVVVMTLFGGVFWSGTNLDSLQTSIAPLAIVAIGMVTLLICGVFDLSVGAIMVLSGIVCAKLFEAGLPVPLVVVIGVLTGALVGLLNGVLVGVFKINPLIATIGTMNMAQGTAMTIFSLSHKGQAEYQIAIKLPQDFINLGTGTLGGLYYMFWVMLVLVILIAVFQRWFPSGRRMYLTGDNPEAAKLMGFKTTRIILLSFVFTGLLCAIAGILSVARFEQANRYMGENVNLTAIISCVLGGASLMGGRGSSVGTIIGVLCMALIANMFNIFEVAPAWQKVVVGVLLIVVVTVDGYLILRKQRELGKI